MDRWAGEQAHQGERVTFATGSGRVGESVLQSVLPRYVRARATF
jgi:hypothetical protein